MQRSRQIRNLALVGFMGTGKTSVGHMLASILSYRMVDTDHLIETRTGKRIADIFAAEGEAKFREYEKEVVAELEGSSDLIIATGGGVAVNPDNLASLKRHALVVCLWASPETILNRVGHQSHRPLLAGADPMDKIRRLMTEREPFYRQADVLINTDLRSLKEAAHQIVHEFRAVVPAGSPA
jgi:shikimate kinase